MTDDHHVTYFTVIKSKTGYVLQKLTLKLTAMLDVASSVPLPLLVNDASIIYLTPTQLLSVLNQLSGH